MQQAGIWNVVTVGQARELPPGPVLFEQLDGEIERAGGRQQGQQQNPIELRGTVLRPTTVTMLARTQPIYEIIGNKRREYLQKSHGACLGEDAGHAQELAEIPRGVCSFRQITKI